VFLHDFGVGSVYEDALFNPGGRVVEERKKEILYKEGN